MSEFEEKFIKPIVQASYPATLAALSLAVLQVTGVQAPLHLKGSLLTAAGLFLVSSFSIFFYTLYPTKRFLWTSSALTFLLGLGNSILSVFLLATI